MKIIINIPGASKEKAEYFLMVFLEKLEQHGVKAPGSGVVYEDEAEINEGLPTLASLHGIGKSRTGDEMSEDFVKRHRGEWDGEEKSS